MRSTFYNSENLTLERRIEIINYAKEKSFKWWVDVLDCDKSFSRQKIEMSYEDIMGKFDIQSHFVIVSRYEPFEKKLFGEIGFSTYKVPSNFLWVYLESSEFNELIKKFKIEKYEE